MIVRYPARQVIARDHLQVVCSRCWLKRIRPRSGLERHHARRNFTAGLTSFQSTSPNVDASTALFKKRYFLPNGRLSGNLLDQTYRKREKSSPEPVASSGPESLSNSTLPKLSSLSTASLSSSSTGQTSTAKVEPPDPGITVCEIVSRKDASSVLTADGDRPLPPDASSRLATLSSTLPTRSLRRLLSTYLSLSKPRLSFLIVLTTTTAYSLYPVPAMLLPSTTASPSLSALTLLYLSTGTALTAASANALNMLLEPEHDAKMSRTRNRPLVRKLISRRGALAFAAATGISGVMALYYGVNPTVAFLGGLNIFLYAGVYTPMKRLSVLNTWVGAIVGGIPPLMGWAAAAGQSATGSGDWRELLMGESSLGGWLLAGFLFAWQFPHFNALSWTIREEYKNAGYRMLAWVNPKMNGRVSLRYSFMFFPLCFGLWWVGITDRGFLVTSSIVNAWMVKEAWSFWRREGQKGTARRLFWASVWHLPVVMVLAMAHKQGLWDRAWSSIKGDQQQAVAEAGLWDSDEDDDEDDVQE
ncbi:MAG: Protoheme IX farnesyltransferase, mitochondrial [Sarcosagium campestre]|nr:MAG: Protoheme IX farnesyltransferase, mitochondrial [Sarcosagium campestre]